MAYWDIVYDTIREVDDKGLHIYVNIYPLGGEEDEEILVFEDNKSVNQFNAMLKERLKDIPEVKQDIKDYVYDVDERDDWYIEEAVGGDEHWTYSDAGFVCSECYKWHFYNNYGACGYVNYKVYDGWIECEDCIKRDENSKKRYVEDLIDNFNSANTILEYKDFLDLGFEKINTEPYANGWYGQEDSPEKILEKAKVDEPDCEFVFSIRKTYNPWETEFDLYRRKTT